MLRIDIYLSEKFHYHISYSLEAINFSVSQEFPYAAAGPHGDGKGPRPRKHFVRIRMKVLYNNYEGFKKKKFIGLRLDPKMLG